MSEDSEESNDGALCTFAVTGPKPHFQAIYLCHTCSKSTSHGQDENEQLMPLCVCYNCAENCHEAKGHDIEFVGDGPAYCDCTSFANAGTSTGACNPSFSPCGCVLLEKSREVAIALNIRKNDGAICSDLAVNVELPDNDGNDFPFVCDVYDIPQLRPCDRLVEQALELVKHSKDTHWVSLQATHGKGGQKQDASFKDETENLYDLCELEILACSIFQRHVDAYNLMSYVDNKSHDFGVEWWVQVKETGDQIDKDVAKSNEAIDLHYDKDEELAASFDIGSFPTLVSVVRGLKFRRILLCGKCISQSIYWLIMILPEHSNLSFGWCIWKRL